MVPVKGVVLLQPVANAVRALVQAKVALLLPNQNQAISNVAAASANQSIVML
jgi:hypothetical protein